MQSPQQLQRRHFAQEQFIDSLLHPWQKIETIQLEKEELPMESRESRKTQDLDSYITTILPPATARTVPRERMGTHPTQSDLVHRFASFLNQFSMSTSYAACQSEHGRASNKPNLARWLNL